MARRVPLSAGSWHTRPSRLWLALAALAAAGSVLAWWLPAAWLDWQPALAVNEPWRAWTAACIHWSPLHLGANLLGLAMVAALGWAARLPRPAAMAWGAAWPLTHAALALQPELAHFGGLSGFLHAGVAVAAVWLMLRPGMNAEEGQQTSETAQRSAIGRQRFVGAAIAVGLGVKLLLEAPWGPVLRHSAGWDIAIAPLAHATGSAAGLLFALLAVAASASQARA